VTGPPGWRATEYPPQGRPAVPSGTLGFGKAINQSHRGTSLAAPLHQQSYPGSELTPLLQHTIWLPIKHYLGRAIVQALGGLLPTAAAQVRAQVRSRGICG
jgi:hypothetical protein